MLWNRENIVETLEFSVKQEEQKKLLMIHLKFLRCISSKTDHIEKTEKKKRES